MLSRLVAPSVEKAPKLAQAGVLSSLVNKRPDHLKQVLGKSFHCIQDFGGDVTRYTHDYIYIYTYIIVSDRMSDGAWPDLDECFT